MSDQDEQENADVTEDYSMGHDVTWDIFVNDLANLQSRPLKKNFDTTCETAPSYWTFEMYLPEVREDGTCSMSIMLERTDCLNLELEASIWISFRDTDDNLIFNKQAFTKAGIKPGNFLQEMVEMTPLPDMRDAIHQNAKVNVIVMVCYCHSDDESSE